MKWLGRSRNDAQLWMCLVVKVKFDAIKNNLHRNLNIRSMSQGKLDVIKQEMLRLNISILTDISDGISGISDGNHWNEYQESVMAMRNFNSDDHYIYYCRQEPLRSHGVALRVNKSLKCRMWVQPWKWQDDLSSFPRQTIQHHSSPRLYLNPFAEDAEVDLWRLKHHLEHHKRISFLLYGIGMSYDEI